MNEQQRANLRAREAQLSWEAQRRRVFPDFSPAEFAAAEHQYEQHRARTSYRQPAHPGAPDAMTLDLLDPGPDHTYPNLPRDTEGYVDFIQAKRLGIDPHTTNVRNEDGHLVPLFEVIPIRPGQA